MQSNTRILRSIAQVSMLYLWFNKNIKTAIDFPRHHSQLLLEYVVAENSENRTVVNDELIQSVSTECLLVVFSSYRYVKSKSIDVVKLRTPCRNSHYLYLIYCFFSFPILLYSMVIR